jgi:hypothetical protein
MKYQAYSPFALQDSPREIDENRYEAVKRAKYVCVVALGFEEKLSLLLGNFFDLEKELLVLAEASLIWTGRNLAESMEERLTLDRRVVNFLTACRLYLDQTEHSISGLFGNPSKELERVKAFRRNLYDEHAGYRLMEALRNHVQHAELPVNTISYNFSRIRGTGPDYFQYTVIPQSEVKTLAENDKFKGKVLDEIKASGARVDLRGPMREYVSCLYKLHELLRTVMAPVLKDARFAYESSVNEFSTFGGKKYEHSRRLEVKDDGATDNEVALVVDFLEYYDQLFARNQIKSDLQRSFASNSDQKVR